MADRTIENRIDKLEETQKGVMKDVLAYIKKHRDAKPGSLDQSKLAAAIEKGIAPRLLPIQEELQRLKTQGLRDQLDAAEGVKPRRRGQIEGADDLATHVGLKHFMDSVNQRRHPSNGGSAGSGKIKVGSFFRRGIDYVPGRSPKGRALKAPELVFDSQTNAPVTIPTYEPDFALQPRLASIFRDLCDSRPVDTSSIITFREVRKGGPATVMTGDINDAATTINVASASGIGTTYPFNKLTLRDGTNEEEVTVTGISGTALTVTRAATSYSFTAALTTVNLKAIVQTNQGVLKPQFLSQMESYDVPVVTLADFMKCTNQALADIAGVEDFINTIGPIFISEMEEWNFLYGPGGGSGNNRGMTGIFTDADIASLTRNADEDLFDFFIRARYNRRQIGVETDALVVSVANHQELSQAQGADGHYIWNIERPEGMPEQVFIGRVYMSDKLQDTDAVIGDFRTACRIYDRMDATVDFGLDGTDWTENQITARFESRVGLGIRLPRYLLTLDTTASSS